MRPDILRGTMDSKQKLPRKMRKVLVEKKRRERIESCVRYIKQLLFQGAEYEKLEKAEILEGVVKHLEHSTKIAGSTAPERKSPDPESKYRLGYLHCMGEITSVLQHVQGTSSTTPLAMSITQYLHNKVNNMATINTTAHEQQRVHNVVMQNNMNRQQVHTNAAIFPVGKFQPSNALKDNAAYRALTDNITIINRAKYLGNTAVRYGEMNVSGDHVVPGNENIQQNIGVFTKSSADSKENVMKVPNNTMWRPW